MKSRIEYIKELQKALELFSLGAGVLDECIDKCTEIGFRSKLNDYLIVYAKLNYDFSTYMIFKLSEAYSKDKDDQDFINLMKQLEDKDGNK